MSNKEQNKPETDHYASCNGCGVGMTQNEIKYTSEDGSDYCNDCYEAIQGDDESSGRLAEREKIIKQMVDIMPFTIAPEVWNYISEAMVVYANQQTKSLYTADQCEKMLEALRQRCAEEAKMQISKVDGGEFQLTQSVFSGQHKIEINKESIININISDLIK